MAAAGPLRYLSSADVLAALPDVGERIRLAEQAMLALGGTVDLPPKIGVQPREAGSLAHAMPALLRGVEEDGSGDLLGIKWVVGFPSNVAAGLPAIHGTTILSDAVTGQPRAFLDAGALTAHRTAAVSGLAISRWGPSSGASLRVAVVGSGAQARSHLPVIAYLLPGARVVVADRDRGRLDALLDDHQRGAIESFRPDGSGDLRVTTDPLDALAGADLVLTMISFGPERQLLAAEAFSPRATIVAVDYDMCVPAAVAVGSELFMVDDREQYLASRLGAVFADYPSDVMTIGEAIVAGTPRPAGHVVITHLGVGIADVIFADAVLRRAEQLGVGTLLAR
jgi:ornithine cyclodeaminase/alanine dehydrogenase-like protein (mu-crystallin family)